jgi:hypothetical protein
MVPMAVAGSATRRAAAPKKGNRLPIWMTVVMAVLLVILVYGILRPKTPNAFDTPEAQMNQLPAPWASPHY